MDILIFGSPDLARWVERPFVDTTRTGREFDDTYERDVATEPPGAPGAVFRAVERAIRVYSIFPPAIVRGVRAHERPIEPGDVVGVHFVRFAPLRLFFCARVVDVFDRVDPDGTWHRAGFTYRTLVGHPELGEETFAVEKELATGRVRVALRSWSRPGTVLAKVFLPFVRRMQVSASRRSLDHLQAVASSSQSSKPA